VSLASHDWHMPVVAINASKYIFIYLFIYVWWDAEENLLTKRQYSSACAGTWRGSG
jgi:hypothetical protein